MFQTVNEVHNLESEQIYNILVNLEGSMLQNLDEEKIQKKIYLSLARQYIIIHCVKPCNKEKYSKTQMLIREKQKENIQWQVRKIAMLIKRKDMRKKNKSYIEPQKSYMADDEDCEELLLQKT